MFVHENQIQKKYCFAIVTTPRHFYMFADSEQEATDWVYSLRMAVHYSMLKKVYNDPRNFLKVRTQDIRHLTFDTWHFVCTHRIVLHCITLHCVILHCTVLILYCITQGGSAKAIEKNGFLKKQGGTIKTMKKRFFLLKDTKLNYYKTEKVMFQFSVTHSEYNLIQCYSIYCYTFSQFLLIHSPIPTLNSHSFALQFPLLIPTL